MRNSFLILLMIGSFKLFAQTDCGSLIGKDENYALGDDWKGWCETPKRTPYTNCMCEREKDDAKKLEQIGSKKEAFGHEFNRLKELGNTAEKNNDNLNAIKYFEETISFAKNNAYFQKESE